MIDHIKSLEFNFHIFASRYDNLYHGNLKWAKI